MEHRASGQRDLKGFAAREAGPVALAGKGRLEGEHPRIVKISTYGGCDGEARTAERRRRALYPRPANETAGCQLLELDAVVTALGDQDQALTERFVSCELWGVRLEPFLALNLILLPLCLLGEGIGNSGVVLRVDLPPPQVRVAKAGSRSPPLPNRRVAHLPRRTRGAGCEPRRLERGPNPTRRPLPAY